jgi:hypothetical protein
MGKPLDLIDQGGRHAMAMWRERQSTREMLWALETGDAAASQLTSGPIGALLLEAPMKAKGKKKGGSGRKC